MFRLSWIIVFLAVLITSCQQKPKVARISKSFDWQGHRGARGLAPENTIPAFIKALEYDVTTLELDLAVSADSQLVVSHEPWFNHAICTQPGGKAISEVDEHRYNIYALSYKAIVQFDCGTLRNPRFAEQQPQAAVKPLLRDVVAAADAYCKANGKPLVRFNIEIKSQPGWYRQFCPAPPEFANLVLTELKQLGIEGRSTIQSFDVAALAAVHQASPGTSTAILVEDPLATPQALIQKLGFTPAIYSPYHLFVTRELSAYCHAQNMQVIPWTVNEVRDMETLISRGVDGLISDYPDRMAAVRKRLKM
jgi:glycerophosphoryl diester phosphodiesterase